MHRPVTPVGLLRWAVSAGAVVLLGWLCVLAVRPSAAEVLPDHVRWFGRPGSWQTILLVMAVLVALCAMGFRAAAARGSGNVPIAVVAGLAGTSAVLGFSSYWHCYDDSHPPFFQALTWTAALVKGGMGDTSLSGNFCPSTTPDALVVARLAALGAIFTGLAGVVIALFRSQLDRLRVSLADSVIAVVGIDEETRSMVSAITQTLDRRSMLVVITSGPDGPGATEARIHGGRVVSVDLNA
ncbi:MAG: hypothetical protein ACRDTV_18130, partial [Mycobacterium sp.]